MSEIVNQADLIEAIAETTNLPKTDAKRALQSLVAAIIDSVAAGRQVRLTDFGTFGVTERSAREGRNPRTGERIHIPASTSPNFRPGKAFKEAVNK